MKRIIPILFALGLWLSLTPQAWGQERNEQGISFIYKGIKSPEKFAPSEGQSPLTRTDETFDLTGCWSCLSEVGSAGGGMSLNTHLPEGYLLIWFNADGTYYQQLGSGGSILVYRRWWNLGGLSFGDSDGFVMQTMSYADGVLTYRGSNIDNPEYSTTVVLKRYNKISLNIGAGTGYLGVKVDKLLKGAAADGETKLRIDVKSITSDYASYRIELSTEYGEDEDLCGMAGELRRTGQTTAEFEYTVPERYPLSNPSSYNVTARLTLYDANGRELTSGETDIEIIRPPVLFVHGLASSQVCFASFCHKLESEGYYKDYQLFRSDYRATATDAFDVNANIVKKDIGLLHAQCYLEGYVTSKADIIGHSMGGLLTRMYLQNQSHKGVNRVITLNTPHFGSQGANLLVNDISPYFFQWVHKDFFNGGKAVNDLMVNSNAISDLSLTANGLKGIPMHAVCTDYSCEGVTNEVIYQVLQAFVHTFYRIQNWLPPIDGNLDLFNKDEINDIMQILYKGKSDMIVSLRSQQGGLSGSNVSVLRGTDHFYNHGFTPDGPAVQARLTELLTTPNNEQEFTKNGLGVKIEPIPTRDDFEQIYSILNGGLANLKRSAASTTKATTSSPTLHITTCEIDESRNLTVTCEAEGDIKASAIVVGIGDESCFTVEDQLSFTRQITVDADEEITVYALAADASGEMTFDQAETRYVPSLGDYDYAVFSEESLVADLWSTDSLFFIQGESYVPMLRLYRDGEYKALVEPDEYILLPELNEDGALEVRDGRLYATGVGRGILAASYGDDGDMVPYRVISPDDITYGDEGTTAVERPMLQPDGGVERLIDFAYIQSGRYARIDFADGAAQEVPYFIYDLNGKLHDRQTVRPQPDCRLPLNHLAKGTYIIIFATWQHAETFKFIVQ